MKSIATQFRVLVIICVLLSGGFPATAGQGIQWKSGVEPLPRVEPAQLGSTVANLAGQGQPRHVVVQFDRPLGSTERTALTNAGLSLLRPLGNNAFFAAFSSDGVDVNALSGMTLVSGMQRVERKWKLHPRVAAKRVPEWAEVGQNAEGRRMVAIYGLFHPDVSLEDEAIPTAERHGVVVRDRIESLNGIVAELPLSRIEAFADEDAVQWIEWPLPRMRPANDNNRVITETDVVNAMPYNLTGDGVNVLVYDVARAWVNHPDLNSNLEIGAGDTSYYTEPSDCHATHVACTVGGQGVDTNKYRGMAPEVHMVSYGAETDGTGIAAYTNPGDLEDDYQEAIDDYEADIANNSIGPNIEEVVAKGEAPVSYCDYQGDYGVTSALLDEILEDPFGQPFRVVWAAGNERPGVNCNVEGYGDYYSIAPPAGAKNPIVVGAVNSDTDSMTSFSSWGPTDDGRVKPDVCAPGAQLGDDQGVTSCSYPYDPRADDPERPEDDFYKFCKDKMYVTGQGTSFAAPTVTGLLALLLEDYRNQFPGADEPRNSTLKALLVHNTVDKGNPGPDYQYGYGAVRIQRTIDFMRTGNFLEHSISSGDTYTRTIPVPAGTAELKVTLAWDDYPATTNVDPALVNDLDLRVFSPTSQRYFPWTLERQLPARAAVQLYEDHKNNIEQIVVANPPSGEWSIEVYGRDIEWDPQTFSLCYSATSPPSACEGDDTWDGCGADACAICAEKLSGYDCYFANHPGCHIGTACNGQFLDCNAACPPPTAADRCTSNPGLISVPIDGTAIDLDFSDVLGSVVSEDLASFSVNVRPYGTNADIASATISLGGNGGYDNVHDGLLAELDTTALRDECYYDIELSVDLDNGAKYNDSVVVKHEWDHHDPMPRMVCVFRSANEGGENDACELVAIVSDPKPAYFKMADWDWRRGRYHLIGSRPNAQYNATAAGWQSFGPALCDPNYDSECLRDCWNITGVAGNYNDGNDGLDNVFCHAGSGCSPVSFSGCPADNQTCVDQAIASLEAAYHKVIYFHYANWQDFCSWLGLCWPVRSFKGCDDDNGNQFYSVWEDGGDDSPRKLYRRARMAPGRTGTGVPGDIYDRFDELYSSSIGPAVIDVNDANPVTVEREGFDPVQDCENCGCPDSSAPYCNASTGECESRCPDGSWFGTCHMDGSFIKYCDDGTLVHGCDRAECSGLTCGDDLQCNWDNGRCVECITSDECNDGTHCTTDWCDYYGMCRNDPIPNDCYLSTNDCGPSPSGCYSCGCGSCGLECKSTWTKSGTTYNCVPKIPCDDYKCDECRWTRPAQQVFD